MDIQELKKILATLSIAGLLTAGIPVTAGCAETTEGSCTGSKKGAKTEEAAEEEKPAEETPAPSS
jgi:radical SAM modification target selenobiotic family peptide